MARLQLPEWGQVFFEPNLRHIAIKGGRGAGAKTRTTATALVAQATTEVRRVLCLRQIQRTIRDSVKTTIEDQILRMGLGMGHNQSGFWRPTRDGIYGANGSRFLFSGLQANVEQIKSIEGITDVWMDEARKATQESLETIEPTIRAPNSRLIWTYNGKLRTDPIDIMFFGGEPPPRSRVLHLQPEDNPWFPSVLREKMEYDMRRDYARYMHIWRGAYWERDDAKVFRNWEVADFETPGDAVLRFGADWGFSVDPTVLVRVFIGRWDGITATADPLGDTLFVDYEAYRVGVEIDDTPALFAGSDDGQIKPRWLNPNADPGVPGSLVWQIRADSARPETISYMQRRGFNIVAATKGPGSLEEGVTFLQNYQIIVHPRCINVADELATYSYKVDPQTEQVLPVLADKKNHTIDSVRYALEAVRLAGAGKIDIRTAGTRAMAGPAPDPTAVLQPDRHNTGQGWGTVAGGGKGLL